MIESIIAPRNAKLAGDMQVRRILPFRARRMVGPFCFLDEMSPFEARPGTHAGDVPPHPHIGLSTVTYLYEGALEHRDSLGTIQEIRPGDLNWMTAGEGIAHSERVPARIREASGRLHGVQAWVALPTDNEDDAPSFQHHGREELPEFDAGGARIRLIAGRAFGRSSPVKTCSRLFYFDARIPAGRTLELDPEGQEAAAYLIEGTLHVGETLEAPVLAVFKAGARISARAGTDTHALFLGGDALEGHRTIWWNFVSTSKEKIERAKTRWKERGFPPIPGETEFVPLPVDPAAAGKSTLP